MMLSLTQRNNHKGFPYNKIKKTVKTPSMKRSKNTKIKKQFLQKNLKGSNKLKTIQIKDKML